MKGLVFNIQKFALHDGAGIRTDVFFQGCNMRCGWCCNPESLPVKPSKPDCAREYELDELLTELLKDKPFYDKSGGGVTFTGGEALMQHEFVSELCDALHASGVNVAIETAGNVSARAFETALKCNTIHIDLKHYDSAAHKRGTGIDNVRIIENIKTALKLCADTILRIPLIPGYNNSPGDAAGFAKLLNELGAREVHLLPFHQMGENKYEDGKYEYAGVSQLHEEDCEDFARVLKDAGMNVQIGG